MKKAREAGIGETIIQEAMEVGRSVRQGASARFDKEASSALLEQ